MPKKIWKLQKNGNLFVNYKETILKLKSLIVTKGCQKVIFININKDITGQWQDNTRHASNFFYLHCSPSAKVE